MGYFLPLRVKDISYGHPKQMETRQTPQLTHCRAPCRHGNDSAPAAVVSEYYYFLWATL